MRFHCNALAAIAALIVFVPSFRATGADATKTASEKRVKPIVGVYYFDGWSGRNRWTDDPSQPWARRAPTHLTRRMIEEFPERVPVWGWRDDSLAIMERQIDLAADHGIAFFCFCWYWHDDGKAINKEAIAADPLHTGLELFLRARNNRRLKFCLHIANHEGFDIKGTENWKQAADFWMPYFKHPLHLTVGGKPLLNITNWRGGDKEGFAYLQQAAIKAGLPGIAVVGCGRAPREMGYTHVSHYNVLPGWEKGLERHKYQELVEHQESRWKGSPELPYMPCVVAGFDRRPWEDPKRKDQKYCWYFPDRTPEAFAAHLQRALDWMEQHPDQTVAERIIMIYAWNEFGEGGYIAPTKGDPEGRYLIALRSVLMRQ